MELLTVAKLRIGIDAVDGQGLDGIVVERSRREVITGTQGKLRGRLQLHTQTQGVRRLQTEVGLSRLPSHLIPFRVLELHRRVVLVLIFGTQSQHRAHRIAQRSINHPRCFELKIAHHRTIQIAVGTGRETSGLGIVIQKDISSQLRTCFVGQCVPRWSMYRQSEAQRRILKGTGYEAKLHVETGTVDAVEALQRVSFVVTIILIVEGIFFVIHIVGTDGRTEIEAVVHIEGHVEVILIHPATFATLEEGIHLVGYYCIESAIQQSPLNAHHAQPSGFVIVPNLRRVKIGADVRIVLLGLLRHGAHLRKIIAIERTHQPIHTQIAVERFAARIVEAKVGVAQGGLVANLHGIDEAGIIKTPAALVVFKAIAIEVALGGIHVVAKSDRGIIAAVDTDTCRVGSHGGDVATQGTHSATHTHKTGRTIQIFLCDVHRIIYRLRPCSHHNQRERQSQK